MLANNITGTCEVTRRYLLWAAVGYGIVVMIHLSAFVM
jgi:hypothetical protein